MKHVCMLYTSTSKVTAAQSDILSMVTATHFNTLQHTTYMYIHIHIYLYIHIIYIYMYIYMHV